MRDDDIGLFWTREVSTEKTKGPRLPRVIPPTPDTGWTCPDSLPNLSGAKRICIDVETKDVDLDDLGPGVRRGGKIVGLAVGTDDARWYFPIRHEYQPELNMNPESVLLWAKDALEGPQPKVGANLLYDMDYLAEEGINVGGDWLDVQVAEPLLDENRFTYNLNVLGKDYLGHGKADSVMEDWIKRAYAPGKNKEKGEIWRTSPTLVGPYAESDVTMPLGILDKQSVELAKQDLTDLFCVETEILPMLLAMRRHGVRVDMVKAQLIDDELTVAINTAQLRLKSIAGFDVNTNAGAHLQRLFDKEGVVYPRTKPTKNAPTGRPSFTKNWLEHCTHPAALCVMDVRKLTKYRDTFIRGYIFKAQINGRIHCLFHSMKGDENGTVSGRFSSSLPNLQNIPIRDEYWGPRIRSIFIPDDGCEWVRHDWSQIEYRFLAHFGIGENAKVVQAMYNDNPLTDFHEMVVELTGLGRKAAKNVNFGLVYGMGPPLLASTLGLTLEEAKREVFDVYHERVPFVKATYERASSKAASRGWVKTIMNRRARFDRWSNGKRDEYGDMHALPYAAAVKAWGQAIKRAFTHKALNRVLQGSAADLMKKAMRDIWKSGVYRYIPHPHLTVHDELDHSRPMTKAAQQAIAEVKHIMENTMHIRVPIIAAEERGPNWGDCK